MPMRSISLFSYPTFSLLIFLSKQLQISEDNSGYYKCPLNHALPAVYDTWTLSLPANSPDLNPIENAWHLLKGQLWKRFTLVEDRPHTEEKLWTAMEEEWEVIDQIKLPFIAF